MKNKMRIVMLLLAFVMLVTCAVSVIASAADQSMPIFADYGKNYVGDEIRISDYKTSTVYRDNTMEDLAQVPNYFGSGESDTHVKAEKAAPDETVRVGAENIYNPTLPKTGFITFNYGAKKDAISTSKAPDRIYKTVSLGSMSDADRNPTNGYVIEFDMAVLSYIDDMGTPNDTSDDERRWEFPSWIDAKGNESDGSMKMEFLTGSSATQLNGKGQQLYTHFLTMKRDYESEEEEYYFTIGGGRSRNVQADEWVHITWVFDPDALTFTMYLGNDKTGREFVGVQKLVEELYPCNFRIGGQCAFGQVSFDNILTYTGTKVHNPKYLADMPVEQRFIYLAECAADTSLSASSRYIASECARVLYENNESIKFGTDPLVNYAVDIYESIVNDEAAMEQLIAGAREYNAMEYVKMVAAVAELPRTLSNIDTRESKIDRIDAYYISLDGMINTENAEYVRARDNLLKMKEWLTKDTNVNTFIVEMERFIACEQLGFVDSMRAHYQTATECKNAANASLSDYEDDDPAKEDSVYKRFAAALESYESASDLLEESEKSQTSVRFVSMVKILLERRAAWGVDDGTCERIWKSAKTLIEGGNYDSNVSGFGDAYYEFYTNGGINDFFWGRIQQMHIDAISAKLAGFDVEGVTYIARNAIIQYVENYMVMNSATIDFTNPTIRELQATAAAYKANLGYYSADFMKELNENEKRFVNIIAMIKQQDTYAGIMQYMEEATDCYYSMNISDDTMDDVVYYEELCVRLDAIAADCRIFIEVADAIEDAENDDELYALLARGFICIESLDSTIEGVDDAKEIYNKAYVEYMNGVNAVNGHVFSATDIVSSVRAYCGIESLVAFADSVFN